MWPLICRNISAQGRRSLVAARGHSVPDRPGVIVIDKARRHPRRVWFIAVSRQPVLREGPD